MHLNSIETSIENLDIKTTVVEVEVNDITKLTPEKDMYQLLLALNIPHPEIVMQQAVIESGHFTAQNAKEANNYLGMMYKGKLIHYDNWIESIIAYKRMFSSKYKGGDYYQFLLDVGYFEDPCYIDKLKATDISKYIE